MTKDHQTLRICDLFAGNYQIPPIREILLGLIRKSSNSSKTSRTLVKTLKTAIISVPWWWIRKIISSTVSKEAQH